MTGIVNLTSEELWHVPGLWHMILHTFTYTFYLYFLSSSNIAKHFEYTEIMRTSLIKYKSKECLLFKIYLKYKNTIALDRNLISLSFYICCVAITLT